MKSFKNKMKPTSKNNLHECDHCKNRFSEICNAYFYDCGCGIAKHFLTGSSSKNHYHFTCKSCAAKFKDDKQIKCLIPDSFLSSKIEKVK